MTTNPFKKKPGHSWRISCTATPDHPQRFAAENLGGFDELVVDDWLHIEQMSDREWWIRIGDRVLWVKVPRSGEGVEVTEGER